MLEIGKTYLDNKQKIITIGGKIKNYSKERPWLWSICGDWYDETTGAYIWYTKSAGHIPCPIEAAKSIGNHSILETAQ